MNTLMTDGRNALRVEPRQRRDAGADLDAMLSLLRATLVGLSSMPRPLAPQSSRGRS